MFDLVLKSTPPLSGRKGRGAIKYDYCYGFWPLERNSFYIILSHHSEEVIASLREYDLNSLIIKGDSVLYVVTLFGRASTELLELV